LICGSRGREPRLHRIPRPRIRGRCNCVSLACGLSRQARPN